MEFEDEQELEEGTSGSAWMFYNHYNPSLLDAMQQILVGSKVEDVVDSLLEADYSLCKGSCQKCLEGTCEIGKKLNCPYQTKAESISDGLGEAKDKKLDWKKKLAESLTKAFDAPQKYKKK